MNENSKTFAFVAAGVAALAVGWFASRPAPTAYGPADEIGKQFFPDFADPQKVAAAEVIDFDATSDTKHDLKVARVDGDWEINPEKQGYPEVNSERLADVINAVSDLKKLSVVSDDRSQHRAFGVVDPASEAELKEGTEGVGKRVDLLDDGRRALVKLIIGKVDDKNTKLHYVREPDRDRVYRTEIDADKLSSRFDDWVKPDLLGASGGDLRFVAVNDYGIDLSQEKKAPVVQGGVMFLPPATLEQIYRAKAVLAKKPPTKPDVTADVWQVDDFQTYDKEKKAFVERKLEAGEELESFKLSDLGRNLGGIKVVDVVKKPKVLAEDLAGDVDFLTNAASPVRKDRDSITELIAYGFRPTQSRTGDEAKLICFEGEMTVGFANGVEYLLRFGDITGKGRGAEAGQKDEAKAEEAKTDEKPADGAAEGSNTAPNRYLMVTARFNEGLIPKPKLTDLPPVPALSTPTEEKQPAEKKPVEEKKEPTKVDPEGGESDCDDQEPVNDDAAKQVEKKDEPAKQDEKPAETKPADVKPAEAKATLVADAPDSAKSEQKKPAAEAQPALTPEERKRIETENKTKQEKYEADVKAGREKAKQLNDQFAPWFYVVSDSTYQGLNVDPMTLIRKAAAGDAAKPATPAVPGLPNLDLLPQNP